MPQTILDQYRPSLLWRWNVPTLAWVVWDGSLTTGALTIGAVTQAGTWTVQPGNTANTTAWRIAGNDAAGAPAAGTVLAVQGIASGTVLPVNKTQVSSVAVLTNEGAAGTGSERVVLGTTATVSQNPVGGVTLGNTLGKVNQLKTGSLTTTATTADQVILTFTTTVGKVFYLQYLTVVVRLTTVSATAAILGAWSLETPSGTKDITMTNVNPTTSAVQPFMTSFDEPIPIAASTVVRVVCTPAAATSTLWIASFGGYEK